MNSNKVRYTENERRIPTEEFSASITVRQINVSTSVGYKKHRKTPNFNGGKDRRKSFGGLQFGKAFSIFNAPNPDTC
jgi:hypothetical protein